MLYTIASITFTIVNIYACTSYCHAAFVVTGQSTPQPGCIVYVGERIVTIFRTPGIVLCKCYYV